MKNGTNFLMVALLLAALWGCNDDDTAPTLAVESKMYPNLYAPQTSNFETSPPTVSGEFVKFSFAKGDVTNSATDWDIAFRGTTILINGGTTTGISEEPERTGNAAVYLEDNTFENVVSVDLDKLRQDGNNGLAIPTGSNNGWYTYNPMLNAIQPLPGKVLVLRTADGKHYAKMEILSYYKDAPTNITPEIATNDARYYTFNYIFQPNEGTTSFE